MSKGGYLTGDAQTRHLEQHGMKIDIDVPIEMDDGIVLRADVFRPVAEGRYPVLMSYGPYGKGLSFQEGYSTAWNIMAEEYPEVLEGSSNLYQNWEVADPEKWVPDGYVVIRVDSRGAGRSPGVLDIHSPRETQDFHDCIEWAARQPWSSGSIGLLGISYYAINQWKVAATQPPSLKALFIWEGSSDRYRESLRHGGIVSTFSRNWLDMQVRNVQHGLGDEGPVSPVTGDTVCGPETIPLEERLNNIRPFWHEVLARPLDDEYYQALSPDLDKVRVPLVSAGNWGGQGLHLRGNVEGFMRAASREKWLEMHGGTHWAIFYTDYALALQKEFFGHYLKGEDTGWTKRPPVLLNIRHADGSFSQRTAEGWPLPETRWTKLHLDPVAGRLGDTPAEGEASFDALKDHLTFLTDPMPEEVEITGPSALYITVSSTTTDADIFAVLHLIDPDGKEVHFVGAIDPKAPLGQGWLRASQRKLDPEKSEPWRPWHPHDEIRPLTPGEPVDLAIEIWPTCIVIPKGYRLGLSIRGRDYEHDTEAAVLSNMKNPMKGCGPFVHDDPRDRPIEIFGGRTTLHVGKGREACLLVPVIPRIA